MESEAAANVSPSEKPQTLTLIDDRKKQERQSNDPDEELETPNGSEATIKALHDEIQVLRRDRSDLQRRTEELLADMARSEAGNKELAARASDLEGELVQTQEDLLSASFVAEDANKDAERLRLEFENLEKKITDLEAERGEKEREVQALKEELRVSEERRAIKEAELKERSKEMELRMEAVNEEVKVRVSREEELQSVIRAMREKNSDIEGDLVNQKSKREEELENAAKALKERNSELEGKIVRSKEAVTLTTASCSKVSWTLVAAAAASTGTIAVVGTAFFLRHGRQR